MIETTRKSRDIVDGYQWRFEVYHQGVKPMLPAAKAFCAEVLDGSRGRWLTFLGPSGIGKTLLMKQIIALLKREWKSIQTGDAAFRTPQMAHIIPATDLEDFKAPRYYAGYDLLYVEDIGSGSGLEGERGPGAVLRGRIAELLQLRTGKWTLLDANYTRGEIASKLDPRIASRIKRDGSVLVSIPGDVPDFNG